MNILNRLLLSHELEIYEPIKYVIDNLNKDDEYFTIEKIDNYQFRFFSKLSLGIGSIIDFFFTHINVNTKFVKIEENKTKVIIYTKLRIDFAFITLIGFLAMLLLTYNQIFNNLDYPFWLNIIFFPIFPAWFWFIYRVQEKELISKVESFIKSL